MSDDGDLIERFVRAALKGELRIPDASHLFADEPESSDLVQPLKDFYAAIATFIGEVNCNRAATATEEDNSKIIAGANGGQTETQPPLPSVGNSTLFHDAQIEIAFRKDDGVITLLPQDKQQCQDLPFLMSQAFELGASDAGVYK